MNDQFVYLDEIVNEYLSQYRLPDSDYGRVASLGIRGRRELHLTSFGQLKTEQLEVSANKTVRVPEEALNIIRVFIDHGNNLQQDLTETDNPYIEDSFHYDRENCILRLPTGFSHHSLMMEFLPQASTDGDYLVNKIFIQPMIDWIIWQDGRGDRKTSDGKNRENERIFYNSLRLARRSAHPFDVSQVYLNYKRVLNNALSAYRWV